MTVTQGGFEVERKDSIPDKDMPICPEHIRIDWNGYSVSGRKKASSNGQRAVRYEYRAKNLNDGKEYLGFSLTEISENMGVGKDHTASVRMACENGHKFRGIWEITKEKINA